MTTPATEAPSTTARTVRLHLVTAGRAPVTVCLRAPEGTSWAKARAAIDGCGIAVPTELYAGNLRLADDLPLGSHPLVNGAQLSGQPTAAEPRHLLDVVVTEGPEVGARTALGPAVQRIGRAASNTLVLPDPELSRTHLIVALDQGRAMVSDTGTTNGSHIDGRPLPAQQPVELRAWQRLRAGSSTFSLERSLSVDDTIATDESCRVPFQRAPRTPLHVDEIELERPTPPSKPERHKLPWPVIVLPAVLAIVMVAVMHNAMFLMFALLGPVMMIGQHISDRQGGSSRAKAQRVEYAEALRRLEGDKTSAAETELGIRRRITPPISDTLRSAVARDGRLWARAPTHPDYLHCRVGTGRIPSHVRVTGGGQGTETLLLPDAPIAFSAADSRVVGVTGASAERTRLVQGLVLQVAAWHSPHFLRIIVVCDNAAARKAWTWAASLPHITATPHSASTIVDLETDESACARMLSDLLPGADDRIAGRDDAAAVSTVVILDDCAQLGNRPEVTALLRDAERAGVALIAIGDPADLPAECDISIEVSSRTAVTVTGAVNATGCPDLPAATLTHALASRLAGIRDASPDVDSGSLPDRAALLSVWRSDGFDATDPAGVTAQWRMTPRSTVAPLGLTGDGILRIDLATDGPHGLIAGTTGAGKSELLQSLVTSLALANRPDEMIFVLIDYKGGAAFQDCAQLPHTVGLVTDLDADLTARALTSLGAEVRRREQVLAAVGAKDLEDYQRIQGIEALPRLVLVIDEFRVLAEEMPDFISGLVRLAAVGRSLGIHLVLATQRPAGVVSADIRANVNLRIALRVRDGSDSQDVIETSDAAQIPATLPGRAIVRTGGGRPITFQTGRIGGCSTGGAAEVEVSLVGSGHTPVLLSTPEETDGPSDLRQVVAAITAASEQLGVRVPDSPWLPPLPTTVTVDELAGAPYGVNGGPCRSDAIPFGLLDVPQEQTTRPIAWDLDADGHLAIVGGPRSGRTSLLRTIAVQAARAWPQDGLAMYVVDTGANLGALDALPQVGAVIDRDDAGRVNQLVQWLAGEIRSRQQQFADDQISGFIEHLRTGGRLPRILLLIDGWEALTEISEETTLGRLTDELLQLLRDGSAVGLYVAATGGRTLATGRVVSSFSRKLVLRLADSADAVLLGMREADLPEVMPPGRAVICPDGLELQVASPIADLTGPAVAEHISVLAQQMRATDVHRLAPMPETCRWTDLPQSTDQVVLGIGGSDITPIGLPFGGFGDLAALIAGPPRSGRTTTLVTIAHQLPDRPVCWIGGHGTPPPPLPPSADVIDATTPEALAAWLNEHPGGGVLVDDIDEMIGSPVDDLITDYLQHGRRHGGIVCASGRSDTLANAYRGAVAELRRRQTGVILQPGRRDGDLLGAQLGPAGRPAPGRGALVIRSRAVPIQVAA